MKIKRRCVWQADGGGTNVVARGMLVVWADDGACLEWNMLARRSKYNWLYYYVGFFSLLLYISLLLLLRARNIHSDPFFSCVVSSSSWHHERCVCCVDQRVISAEYFHIASNSRPAPMNHCCSDIMPVTKGHIVTAMDIIAWLHVHDLLAYFCAVAIAVCVARRHHRHLDPIVWCVAFWFATIHFDIGANDDDDVATIWTPSFGYRALHTCLCLHATFSICLQLWYGTWLGMEKREYMRICWNSTSTNK